jgi:glucose/arabinose dehydrogenase
MGVMMQPRRTLAVVLLGVLVVACNGTPSSVAPSPSGTAAPTSVLTPTAPVASATPEATATPVPTIADQPPALGLEAAGTGFASPIGIAAAADGWLLINERAGRVVALDPATGETAVTLDLSDRVLDGGQFGEQGLLGLVLHPDWPDDGRAFVHYNDRNGDTVVSEFTGAQGSGEAPALAVESETVLLAVDQPFANHNGGQLAFGPDGYLYVGLGDGGSGGDPEGNGQNPSRLLGKILRLDVATVGGYAIPDDNPFVAGGGAPEVFVYGLRNPWRFSFDRETELLWIADVGQNAFEEIDRIDPATDAAANLGWSVMEASHCYDSAECATDGLVLPVAEYGRDLGCSVTGGYVYRGESVPGLAGWYLFSDYCTGLLFGLRSDATGVNAPSILLETGASVSSFGEGADGELYVADLRSGTVYRIVAGG